LKELLPHDEFNNDKDEIDIIHSIFMRKFERLNIGYYAERNDEEECKNYKSYHLWKLLS